MTQVELGRRCGVLRSTISKIESGNRAPSFRLIERIVRELGGAVNPGDFFTNEGARGDAGMAAE